MSEYRKAHKDELYFITLSVVGWIDVFTRREYKDILVENLDYCQRKEGLEIYAYVIMTNHLHLIARRQEKDLGELLKRFKSYTAKKIIAAIESNPQESRKEWMLAMFQHFALKNKQYGKYHFWQYTNHPTLLYSAEVIEQKKKYIHMNPVKAGIVIEPEYYFHSSACAESPLKVMEI
ncbi:REP-associated tyrosine transposase [Pontibacter arcticus]|uniref:Transposase n=1 Tax=Pontibacter arcticus TaxID=2080288 RepID=A0A364RD51_9BACT|nr:transposase [Pontibacter arcticus]RAU82199.1 transposase [Pontibacter arcticus]